jgi:hypothetical protein
MGCPGLEWKIQIQNRQHFFTNQAHPEPNLVFAASEKSALNFSRPP